MRDAVSIAEQVDRVPSKPGCYLWKGAENKVLYVGKAKNLRGRMRQYVQRTDDRLMIPMLMSEVTSFEYVVTATEHEALLLEINLIHQHKPPYNVDLKDDKSYPFIALTKGDVFPALSYTREHRKKGTRYFGPYTDARAARDTITTVRKVMPVCVSSCAEWRRVKRLVDAHPDVEDVPALIRGQKGRACFDSCVGRCPGVCSGDIAPFEYARNVAAVERFLAGQRSTFVHELTEEMNDAAAHLDYERAERIKRRLDAIAALDNRQKVVLSSTVNADVVGIWREETIAGASVFVVREGRVVRTCAFVLDKGLDVGTDELISSFIKRYYSATADFPLEVALRYKPPDAPELAVWLSEQRGRKVTIRAPKRGEKVKLCDMAEANARYALMRYALRTGYEDTRLNTALIELESALALEGPPMRIECFDVSTIHGNFTVASMVVFAAGRPEKSQYRRFRVRTPLDESNDVLSMSEVLARRYAPARVEDARFGALPDLLILDGGKPQLTAAIKQLSALGLNIPVAGLAKSDEELFVAWSDTPVMLPSGSTSLYLVKRIRDEAHRFAITYHRELRDKAMTASVLDDVPGLGPKRRKALLKAFGGMRRLRAASLEALVAAHAVPEQIARDVYAVLHKERYTQSAAVCDERRSNVSDR